MKMKIRKSEIKDLKALMPIYDYARSFMRSHGNPNQWINGYPSEEVIVSEINSGHSFVCEDDEHGIVGTFCFILGDDPTYDIIEDGHWLNDSPYGTIHRMATSGKVRGISQHCIDWCFTQCPNIRVDTHSDNIVMQNIMKKCGFTRCGIIYTHNGTPRIAYQKCI
jgi:hypothetical protein